MPAKAKTKRKTATARSKTAKKTTRGKKKQR